MKPAFPIRSPRTVLIAAAAIFLGGCCMAPKPAPEPPATHTQGTGQCPAKYPKHYADAAQGYSICLPSNVSKTSADGLPAGTAVFTGFSVPAGTNLTSKRLIVQPGADDILQDATPFGSFTADGVTFQRFQESDAGAGQQYFNVIYVWKHNGKQLNFVFEHHAVNPGMVGPPSPTVYNQAAQVKITVEIMKTFRRMH